MTGLTFSVRSSMSASLNLFVPSSAICQSKAGISTSLLMGHHFLKVSKGQSGGEFPPSPGVLARVLNPMA